MLTWKFIWEIRVKTPATLKESVDTTTLVVPKEVAEALGPGDDKTGSYTAHSFQGSQGNLTYMAQYADFPRWVFTVGDKAAGIEAALDNEANGLAAFCNGKLILETKISLGDSPGREALLEFQQNGRKAIMKARYYIVGQRMYLTWVVAPSGEGDMDKINAFLDSFQLVQ